MLYTDLGRGWFVKSASDAVKDFHGAFETPHDALHNNNDNNNDNDNDKGRKASQVESNHKGREGQGRAQQRDKLNNNSDYKF